MIVIYKQNAFDDPNRIIESVFYVLENDVVPASFVLFIPFRLDDGVQAFLASSIFSCSFASSPKCV
ncbi:hypothetical protein ALCH109712_06005 [Alkalicoccus chagannorensis]